MNPIPFEQFCPPLLHLSMKEQCYFLIYTIHVVSRYITAKMMRSDHETDNSLVVI